MNPSTSTGTRVIIALAAFCLVAIGCAGFFLRTDSEPTARVAALEREIETLRAQLREREPIAVFDPARPLTTSPELTATTTNQDFAERIARSVERLEKICAELNERISRSKLAVPTRGELEASLAKKFPEMDKYQQAIQAALAEARGIAASENINFNEKTFLDLNAEIPLPRNERYMAIRASAIQNHRLLEHIEVLFAQKSFESRGLPDR